MKAIFPLLLCYVLMTSQTFALSGGPVYRSKTSYIGYYAGTLRAIVDVLNPDSNNPRFLTPNAVGMYNVSIDASANSTGNFLLFLNGIIYNGTVTALVNPTNGKMTGVISATNIFTDSTGASNTSVASGVMNAKIDSGSTSGSSTALRMNGKATLQVNFDVYNGTTLKPTTPTQTLVFNVSGFQQTTITTTTISGGSSTGTGT